MKLKSKQHIPAYLSLFLVGLVAIVLVFNQESAVAQSTEAMDAKQQKIKVLILTGMEHPAHNWKTRTVALKELIEEDPRFEVAVSEDPEFLASPDLQQHDVVLMNFWSGKKGYPGQASKDNLVKYLKQDGKGLFILHFACGNFHDWPEFNKIAGMVFTPEGRPGFHDPYRPFDIKITDPDHQITKGLPNTLKAHDECYYCLGNATGPYHILATANSNNTKKDHPMAFTVEYGKGRVFHTPLGHDARSVKMPDVAKLIRRGLIWAAGKN